MTPPKRRKRSGLSGVELHQTIQVIKGLIDKWRVEEAAAEEDEEADDQKGSEVSQLQDVLEMLTTKLDGPQVWVSQICRKPQAERSTLDLLVLYHVRRTSRQYEHILVRCTQVEPRFSIARSGDRFCWRGPTLVCRWTVSPPLFPEASCSTYGKYTRCRIQGIFS